MARGSSRGGVRASIESKLYSDVAIIVQTIRFIDGVVPGFFKFGVPLLVAVYLARGVANGVFTPHSIAYIVDGFKENDGDRVNLGVGLLLSTAAILVVTEFAQMAFFKRLSRAIVSLKQRLTWLVKTKQLKDNPEDLVGKISSDVDFIVWNTNAFLTTLLPNLFTATTALYSVFSFDRIIGILATLTLVPYALYAELYSRRIEKYRSLERETYAESIVQIRNIVYGDISSSEELEGVLKRWEHSVNKIMWMDRYYFALSFITSFTSVAAVALLGAERVREEAIGVGSLAGIIYATLTAHFGMLNATWAFCILGQTVATIKRILNHLQLMGGKKTQSNSKIVVKPIFIIIKRPKSKTHTDH